MILHWLYIIFFLHYSLAQLNDQSTQHSINLNDPIVCDCGFIDEYNNTWSDIWFADYTQYKSRLQQDSNYMVMNYVIKAKRENSIDRVFSTNNVALDGQGVTLEVKKNVFGKQTSAAFGTRRDDFLYGSYRAKMKLTDISGTVSAFYFYRNDTCEIDIESLSKLKDPDQVYFAIQPQVYHKNGSAAYVTSEKHPLPFVSSTGYHEYRFDWLPHSVNFYIDGVLVREMTTNIPKSPGRILFSHWTDGNPNFSGDLPTENAFMKIAQLNMFFNSSNSDRPPVCQKSTSPCSVWEIMNRSIIPESLAMNTGNANVLRLSWLFISLTSLSFLLSFVM